MKLTDASGSIRAGDEASRTGAHVAAGRVGALPSVAHARDGAALVDVCGEANHSFTKGFAGSAEAASSVFSLAAEETQSRFSAVVITSL